MDHTAHLHHHHFESLPASPNAFEWAGFAAIFSYSFLVSFHCFGMCGPLACSMLGRSRLSPWKSSLLYNFGRLVSYCAAGAGAGFLAASISGLWPGLTKSIGVVFGALICLWALTALFNLEGLWPEFPGKRLLLWVQSFITSLPAPLSSFSLGLVTILLPCMTLHPLLFMSVAHQNAADGAMTMLAFFAGTLPAMVSATYMPTLIADRGNLRRFAPLGRVFLFLAGLLTMGRAWLHS